MKVTQAANDKSSIKSIGLRLWGHGLEFQLGINLKSGKIMTCFNRENAVIYYLRLKKCFDAHSIELNRCQP